MKSLKFHLLSVAATVVALIASSGVGTACWASVYEPQPPAELIRK